MKKIAAIPTIYKGIACRSRLEARICALLDDRGVFFDYEPELGLRGYIPDLLCTFGDQRVIVECKPIQTAKDFLAPQAKVVRSGWTGPVMIIGGALEIGADGRPDIVARGTIACRRGTPWYQVGRACWPPTWGPQPFGAADELLTAWRAAGSITQWQPKP